MNPAAELSDTEPHRPSMATPSMRPSGVRLGSVRLGSVPANADQDVRFVQDRMALFGKTTFLISSMFLVATSAADLVVEIRRYSEPSRVSHVIGTLLGLALWLIARNRRSLTVGTLQTLDIAATLGICWSFAAMGYFGRQPYSSYTALLAITHVSLSRAIMVPSVPARTLLLGILCFAGPILSRATVALPTDLAVAAGGRIRAVLDAVLWSTAGSAAVTLASRVIYGLHEKALEARQLGQYSLEEKIGEGGMGEVYRAHHAMLRRPTAVKLLAGDGSEGQLRRFEREVQLTARLTHPNTISIYDFGRTPEGVFYYAMELLDGLTLEQLVERHGPQPPGRAIHILQQVCGALAEAHRIGLIHRDIKPANIHLGRRGDVADFVKVLDFGLVREVGSNHKVAESNLNAVVGTPLYLSPEAILKPDRMDARADIYGLGCVAYYVLTGSPPFEGNNVVELCAHHLHTPPPPPSERHPVPDDVERVILSCLAKDPAARPQTARDLSNLLRRCRDAQGWSAADAEKWWTQTATASSPTAAASKSAKVEESGKQIRRTICCADIEERCARRDEKRREMGARSLI
jgi:eukaryotic-like serine/threonine-protein kinase